jgi:acyl-CoA synthetase (AMP-forming)/AMP-acid ligase II
MEIEELLPLWLEWEDLPALIEEQKIWTYGQLARSVQQNILELKTVLAEGECVGLKGGYSFENIGRFFALLIHKATVVPYAGTNSAEWEQRTASAPVRAIWESGLSLHLLPNTSIERGTPSGQWVLFSSGTTGKPKTVIHYFAEHLSHFSKRKPRKQRTLALLLFDHIGGINTLFQTLFSGGTLVVPAERTPEGIAICLRSRSIGVFPSTPSFLLMMVLQGLWKPEEWPHLRLVSYGTEPMPPKLLSELKSSSRHIRFVQTFGTSETGITKIVPSKLDPLAFFIDTHHTEWKVVEDELYLRSKTQGKPIDSQMESGTEMDLPWFKTGDRVSVLPDGSIRIQGRIRQWMNVGGEKVYPAEIEEAIGSLNGVYSCVVQGEPYPVLGTRITATVVVKDSPDLEAQKVRIRKATLELLEPYKVPARWLWKTELSMTDRLKASSVG